MGMINLSWHGYSKQEGRKLDVAKAGGGRELEARMGRE